MYGNGLTNLLMNTRAAASCVAAAITNLRDRCGISRKPIASTSTATSSSWRRAKIGPERLVFVVSRMQSSRLVSWFDTTARPIHLAEQRLDQSERHGEPECSWPAK